MNPVRFGAVIKFVGSAESTYYRALDFKFGLEQLNKPAVMFPFKQENDEFGHMLLTGQDARDYQDLTDAVTSVEDEFRRGKYTQEMRHAYTHHPNAMTVNVDEEITDIPLDD